MTLHFHDVSHYQGDYHPTGPTIAKATEGTGYVDPTFATNRSRTAAGSWPFAGYHFLDPGNAGAQATHAISVISHNTPAMLDTERSKGGNASFADTLAFIDEYRKLGGILYLVYLPKWYWSGVWGSPSLTPLLDRGMSLISSQYTTYSDTGPGWAPYGGMTPVIWQHTSTPIDTNAFRGTEAALADLFNGTTDGGGDVPVSTFDADDKKFITDTINAAVATVAKQVWGYDPNAAGQAGLGTPAWRSDAATNPTASYAWGVRYILDMVHQLGLAVGVDMSDLPAVAAAAAPNLTSMVDAIPTDVDTGGDGVTDAEMAAAYRAAADVLDPPAAGQ